MLPARCSIQRDYTSPAACLQSVDPESPAHAPGLTPHHPAANLMVMSLSTAELAAVVRNLKPLLEGGRIERMDQPEADRLVLYVRKGPALYWVLLCTHPQFARLHLLTNRPPRSKPASGFCSILRDHATTAELNVLRRAPGDRIVVVEFTGRDRLMQPRPMRLIAEMFAPGGNFVLTDEADRILAVNRRVDSPRRRLVPGAVYELPEPPPKSERDAENRFDGLADAGDAPALSRAVQSLYATLEARERLEGLRAGLSKALRAAAKSARRKAAGIGRALDEARNADAIRRQGELLKIALPNVPPRRDRIEVDDVFDPALPKVVVELNPALSPEENIEWLFRRYKKARAGADRLAERAREAEERLGAVERLAKDAADARTEAELAVLQDAVERLGVPTGPRSAARPRPAEAAPRGPRTFRSEDGSEILVARSRRENEHLTLSIARGNDYWLHLADWPGPHVIVRAPRGEVSEPALLDAAHLAVHFSRLRGADQADVLYTQCKHVRRLKGGSPGRVSLARARTLRVRIDPERLERLLRPAPAGQRRGGPGGGRAARP